MNSGVAIYWSGLSQSQLAAFQQNQGSGFDCGPYATATVLNMLYGGGVSGRDVANLANHHVNLLGLLAFSANPGLRSGSDWATSPNQQAAFFNGLANQLGWPLNAHATLGSKQDLLVNLASNDKLTIVTIAWDSGFTPWIARDSDAASQFPAVTSKTAHAMVLAAYDPSHKNPSDPSGRFSEWGFVNSYVDRGSMMYWMPDEDFDKAFYHPFLWPSGNMVTVSMK